jgi:hypothetical protein
MKYALLTLLLLFGCSDASDIHRGGNGAVEKSLLGNYCAPGCIWSSYAVSTGVQKLTHYCDGQGCHCVEDGDIYMSCSLDNTSPQEEENVQHSAWSNEYNSIKGNKIADEAYYEASRRGTYGYCYNAVADAVERITGRFLWGSHAYQAADQFAASSHFYEVYSYNIRSLPAGAIVVWGKGSSKSGHISVALGNGQEASDHITTQMTYHYGGAPSRVFYPK